MIMRIAKVTLKRKFARAACWMVRVEDKKAQSAPKLTTTTSRSFGAQVRSGKKQSNALKVFTANVARDRQQSP